MDEESKESKDYKTIDIFVPDGWIFYEYNTTTNEMVLKRTDNKASLKWTEGEYLTGYYLNFNSVVCSTDEDAAKYERNISNVNIFKTSKQAHAANALAMLSQQIHRANGGWKPTWSTDEERFVIWAPNSGNNKFIVLPSTLSYNFLTFKSKEIAEEFLKTNIDLLKQAAVFLT